MSRYVVAFLFGVAVGAGLGWLLFRGDGNAALRAERDAALRADSLKQLRIDSLELERDSLVRTATVATVLYHETKADLDSVLGLPPRIRVIVDTVRDSTGALVPVEWVRRADYDTLRTACLAFRNACEEKQRADSVLLVAERRLTLAERMRADSLALTIREFPIPREPSRWSLGCGLGYGAVVSAGEVRAGPGGTCGLTLNFR